MSRLRCADTTCVAEDGVGACVGCGLHLCGTHAWVLRCTGGGRHDTSPDQCFTRLLTPAEHERLRIKRSRGIAAARAALRMKKARKFEMVWLACRRVDETAKRLKVSRSVAISMLELAGVAHGELRDERKQRLMALADGGVSLNEAAVACGLSIKVARATLERMDR